MLTMTTSSLKLAASTSSWFPGIDNAAEPIAWHMQMQFENPALSDRKLESAHKAPSPDDVRGSTRMQSITYLGSQLRKPRLRFCLRATVNALLAFGLAQV